MLTDNKKFFRNCFVIIYCYLTKVSSQINKYIIFEPNEHSTTLSTLWLNACSLVKERKVIQINVEVKDNDL